MSESGRIDVFTFDIQTNTGQIVHQLPYTGIGPVQYKDSGYLQVGQMYSGDVVFSVPEGQRIIQVIAVDSGIGRSPSQSGRCRDAGGDLESRQLSNAGLRAIQGPSRLSGTGSDS